MIRDEIETSRIQTFYDEREKSTFTLLQQPPHAGDLLKRVLDHQLEAELQNVNFCTQSKCPRLIFTPREERKSRQVYLEGMVVAQVLLQVNALSNPLLHVKGLKCFSAILQCLNEICKQRVFLLTCMFAALSLTQLLITKRYLAQKKVG